jgi:hypothetical protein
MSAIDHGVVLRHGPEVFDAGGARDVWVWKHEHKWYMHYDAAGPEAWVCSLATSDDGIVWTKQGRILSLGAADQPDSRSASYGVTIQEAGLWHMFYLGTPHVGQPGNVPAFPYECMKATAPAPSGPWRKQYDVVPWRCTPGTYYADTSSPGQIVRHDEQYLQFFPQRRGLRWA